MSRSRYGVRLLPAWGMTEVVTTPIFAEMAVPGSTFEGAWEEKSVRAASRRLTTPAFTETTVT